jgi:hypothetical protein
VQDLHRAAAAPSGSAPWERTAGPASEARRRPYLLHQTKDNYPPCYWPRRENESNRTESKQHAARHNTTDKRPAHARARTRNSERVRRAAKDGWLCCSLPPDLRTAMCAATSAALTVPFRQAGTTHTLPFARSLVFSFSPSRGKAPAPS